MAQDIERLLRAMKLRSSSSLHLLWAWYGAGKTHSLLYLANRATTAGIALAAHCEFNRGTSFLDLFKALSASMKIDELETAFLEAYTGESLGSDLQSDTERALYASVTGGPSVRRLAERYIRGELLSRQEARELDVAGPIRRSQEASDAIAAIARILGVGSGRRLLIIVDEFQRIAETPPRQREDILTGLHATFNAAPEYLTIVVSFSGQPQAAAPTWLSREIADRIGLEKTLILPPMNRDEAQRFFADVFLHHRNPGYSGAPMFPFTDDAIAEIINWVQHNADMKPRALVQAASAVLEEFDPQMQEGSISEITRDDVLATLASRTAMLKASIAQ
jgi:hypothetical protein